MKSTRIVTNFLHSWRLQRQIRYSELANCLLSAIVLPVVRTTDKKQLSSSSQSYLNWRWSRQLFKTCVINGVDFPVRGKPARYFSTYIRESLWSRVKSLTNVTCLPAASCVFMDCSREQCFMQDFACGDVGYYFTFSPFLSSCHEAASRIHLRGLEKRCKLPQRGCCKRILGGIHNIEPYLVAANDVHFWPNNMQHCITCITGYIPSSIRRCLLKVGVSPLWTWMTPWSG